MPPSDDKVRALRRHGSLNMQADQVHDELFHERDFFDARDLVQVKYEMLRHVEHDGWSVSRSADEFGFSRPTFYQAKEAFESDGLWGLIPERRGPRGPRKLTGEIVEYIAERLQCNPSLNAKDLAGALEERFGVKVHPRTITRHLARRQKKR